MSRRKSLDVPKETVVERSDPKPLDPEVRQAVEGQTLSQDTVGHGKIKEQIL